MIPRKSHVIAALLSARLAIDAYQFDHGSPPDTLADLVPEYLPSVPVDASSPSGEPLLYRRTDDGFMVYACGRDGDDDGGKATELGGLETEGDLTLEGLFPPDPGP